ncbi:unnamed protein product [Plutella xylostella]|uniref:(diamondback moth) hypothetical protein n=1 Tax=Plutella xylostella TaxID=51655 RepID=A0A8S4FZS5_PLUXY|nr:unnamed protein product [Plutella xylostella]
MSESEDTFCRLCAEPTPLEQLISTTDDVGQNSKITTKMLWINIDVSTANNLPKTICFSCFDLLERTWSFLHNVRTAQDKLHQIFTRKDNDSENDEKSHENTGKPVDRNWELFQDTKEFKHEVTVKDIDEIKVVDPNTLMKDVKTEPNDSDREMSLVDMRGASTDSDMPLKLHAKKKKSKTKKKIKKYEEALLELDYLQKADTDVVQLDMSTYNFVTWDDLTYCCANCDAQCKSLDSLRLHAVEIHNRCCSFKCSECSKVLQSFTSFINHVRLHFKSLRYHCEYCNKHFRMSTLVKKHRNMTHKGAYSNVCRNCGLNFEDQESLRSHMLLYAKGLRRVELVKSELTDAELKCDECGREYKSRSNLQAHKLVHTERKREFSCHVCGKMFYTKGALSTHMSTHEDLKPYKCAFCPMAFRARGNLTSHISLHTGAKPFVCEQCGKSFRVKRHLKSHSIVHTDLMPYVCEYCNKSFRFKTRLNLHIRQHTGAKPYTCVYCRRDFTNGSNYKKHMKRRHNIDTSVRKKFNNIVMDIEGVPIVPELALTATSNSNSISAN